MTAQRKGIDNTPGSGEIKNLGNVAYDILEPVRAKFDLPISVSSGYRSEELCEAIGSKKTSQHALGCAVDFEINSIPNIKVAYWLVNNVDFDQCILEYYKPDDGQGDGSTYLITNQVQTENKFLLLMVKNILTVFPI